ncbi:MAG: hypothetical protein Q7V62_10820, partial [Actinomycetota bacterium]|nr:hypothetical protein [Actinomycetota bacterium]
DLGALVGLPELASWGLDLSAAATMNLGASAQFNLGFGFDLSDVTNPEFFIDDSTGIDLSVSASLDNIDLEASFDTGLIELGMWVNGGSASIGLDMRLGLAEESEDNRYDPLDLSLDDVEAVVSGAAVLDLPLYFPLEAIPAGGTEDDRNGDGHGDNVLHLSAAFEFDILNAELETTTEFVVPDLVPSAGLFDIINDPGMVLSGVEGMFDNLKAGIESKFAQLVLPMIGDELQDAADFVGDLKYDLLGEQATSTKEINTIEFTAGTTAGTFKLKVGSTEPTTVITWSDDATTMEAAIKAALETDYPTQTFTVEQIGTGKYDIIFNTAGAQDAITIVADAVFTGGGATIAMTREGFTAAAGQKLWRDSNNDPTLTPTGDPYYEDGG